MKYRYMKRYTLAFIIFFNSSAFDDSCSVVAYVDLALLIVLICFQCSFHDAFNKISFAACVHNIAWSKLAAVSHVCKYVVVRATGLLCLLGISVGIGSLLVYRLYTRLFAASVSSRRKRHVSDLCSATSCASEKSNVVVRFGVTNFGAGF